MKIRALVLSTLVLLSAVVSRPAIAAHEPWHGHIGPPPHFYGPHWREGYWHYGWYGGHLGWWWVIDGAWYLYPTPVYPYPDVVTVPVVTLPAPAPVPAATGQPFWYWCDQPAGYYPTVPTCSIPWKAVPAGTNTAGVSATAQPQAKDQSKPVSGG